MPKHRYPPRAHYAVRRRGATIVEFALTAPILLMLVFAGIEFSRANMLLHTAAISATEGARKGIVSGATAKDVKEAAFAELQPLGIRSARVIVKPDEINPETDMITVGVCVPLTTDNFYMTPKFFLGEDVIKVVSITREAKSGKDAKAKAAAATKSVAADLAGGLGDAIGDVLDDLLPGLPLGGDDDDDDD
ncbi:TadE-like protein [Posidoniimonas corsicana]|uniref:TadE-like protein n=1 Tax=Posidoniimonas corsicana TaxID=1938618 RepID=A0A5C5UXY2_9BACT|nr:TadE family protein [Posidoniimonas corsicana]TWT30305.1 TadE-like protein [Posidoniimonas corsicana]